MSSTKAPRTRAPHATVSALRRDTAIQAAIQGFRRAFTGFNRLLSGASGGVVSVADTLALHFIAHAGTVTPGQIGSFTGLTSGSVTTMLDRLERAGFVVRRRSREDRRVVILNLRPGAREKIVAMMMEAHEGAARMFEGWSERQIKALTRMLDRLDLERA